MSNCNKGQPFSLDNAESEFLKDAVRHNAGRRMLLHWMAGMGLASATGLPLIAEAANAVAMTPVKGGSVKIASASASTTDTLDPAKGSNSTDYARHYMFYNGLTTLDEQLIPAMTLAESIESTDFVNWNIKVRKGINFHDGSPLTPADIVYSLSRHKDGAVGSKVRALALQMETIVADGPGNVKVILSSPNADLPVMLGVSHFLIVKNGVTDFAKANGTGPFLCESFLPGTRSVAVRNEKYWKPGLPHLDRIEFFGIGDESARVNALLSGDADMIGDISANSARQLKQAPHIALMETKGGSFTSMIMRLDSPPGNNADFVEATKYMFDREQIKQAVFGGYAVVANDQPLPPSSRYYDASLPQRPYDPDKARFHLKKAGMTGAAVDFVVSPAASRSLEIGQLFQQTARGAGLNVNLRRVAAEGYWSNQWMKHPITAGATNARPSADLVFSLYFKSDSPWNESAWKNPQFDQLLIAARGERDEAKRKQMYSDMQRLVSNGSGLAIPVFRSALDAFSDRVQGMKPIPLGNFMGYMFPENIWLKPKSA